MRFLSSTWLLSLLLLTVACANPSPDVVESTPAATIAAATPIPTLQPTKAPRPTPTVKPEPKIDRNITIVMPPAVTVPPAVPFIPPTVAIQRPVPTLRVVTPPPLFVSTPTPLPMVTMPTLDVGKSTLPTLDAGNFTLPTSLPIEEAPTVDDARVALVSHTPRGDLYEFVLMESWTYAEELSGSHPETDKHVHIYLAPDNDGELSVLDAPAYEGFSFNELYGLAKSEFVGQVEYLLGWQVVAHQDLGQGVFKLTGRKDSEGGHCPSILYGMLAVTEERIFSLFLILCNYDETDDYAIAIADLILDTLWYEGKPK